MNNFKSNPASGWTLSAASALALVSFLWDIKIIAIDMEEGWLLSHPAITAYWLVRMLAPLALFAAVALFVLDRKIKKAITVMLVGFFAVSDLFLLVFGFAWAASMPDIDDPWESAVYWLIPNNGFDWVHYASVLTAIVGIMLFLSLKNRPQGIGVSQPAAAGRTPVGFDTQTGRPIYGYDVNTGQPIF
jgi:hypothetical protein